MKESLRTAARMIEEFNRAMYWVSAGAILLSSLILTYEVVMRYFLKIPTIWEVETAVYLGILATFLGAAYGLKTEPTSILTLLPGPSPRGCSVNSRRSPRFSPFSFASTWPTRGGNCFGSLFQGWKSDSLWGPPLAIPYFFLPLGLTLLSLQFIIQIFGLGKPKETSISR